MKKTRDWRRVIVDDCYKTKSYKKLWNYFVEIIEGDYFQKRIKELRKWYQIPKDGFLNEGGTIPPEQWKLRNNGKSCAKLNIDLRKLCSHYNLLFFDWGLLMENYLFYNTYTQYLDANSFNLCWIVDVNEIKDEPFEKTTSDDDDKIFPIAIRVSPYASQRDIIDYIKKMYSFIQYLQDRYKSEKVNIGRVRAKNPLIQQRNKFIYEHRDLPRRKIVSLVNAQFPSSISNPIDLGSVGKIISLEKKRRKEV